MASTGHLFLLALIVCFGYAQAADRSLAFALKQRNLGLVERLFWERSDPTHADYGKWLTLDEMAIITGATDETLEEVQAQLRLIGARNVRVAPSREYVLAEFSNTNANVILKDLGHSHAARKAVKDLFLEKVAMPTITFTSAFHSHIEYVVEYSETLQLEMLATVETERYQSRFRREAVAGIVADPNTQKRSYRMPTDLVATAKGNSQAVWGPGTFGVLTSDLSAFYNQYGLLASVSQVNVPFFKGQPGGDNFGEGTLDTSYITAMAPGVPTYVLNTNTSESTEEGPGFGYAIENFFLLNLAQAADLPKLLSMSLGSLSYDSCDKMCQIAQSTGQLTYAACLQYVQYTQRQVCMMDSAPQSVRISNEFMKLGLRGMTLLTATGDGGSHFSFGFFPSDPIGSILNQVSCTYNFATFPPVSPYVLTVGGTQWKNQGPIDAPIGWTGGAGFSWRFPRPAYQKEAVEGYLKANLGKPGMSSTLFFNSSNRAYPDVAAIAHNVPMFLQGRGVTTGGTSASAPTMAGLLSMINDARLNAGKSSLGFVNTALYKLAAEHPGELFYDVTQGNSLCGSDGNCCTTGFLAAPGWDPVTGLGSPLFDGLIKYLG